MNFISIYHKFGSITALSLLFFLFTLNFNTKLAAQTTDPVTGSGSEQITKSKKRTLKIALKKFQKKILQSPELSEKYFQLINTCKEDDLACQEHLKSIVDETIQGSALDQSKGLTFGICKPNKEHQALHKVVFSKKSYDCKLSSHGNVFNKNVHRKIYGPGLYWDKQPIVLFCTGPAYGKKMVGTTIAVGAYFGITTTAVFGKIGACVAIGAGKSLGFFVGVDAYRFDQ